MKTDQLKYLLPVSMLALVIGLGMPIFAQAEDAANANSGENAEAMSSGETGTDADYEAENKDEQKVEGYKRYVIDRSGHPTAVLSSDLPPSAERDAVETEASEQPEQPQHHAAKKNSNTAVQAKRIQRAPTPENDANAGTEAMPIQDKNTVSENADEDQPSPKPTHHSGNGKVAGTDDSSKPGKAPSVIQHTVSASMAKPDPDVDHKTQAKLAHLKLFRHRIRRTEAEKMASGEDAASGQGQ